VAFICDSLQPRVGLRAEFRLVEQQAPHCSVVVDDKVRELHGMQCRSRGLANDSRVFHE